MTATERYIEVLTALKPGDLGLLRTHAGRGLDESVGGFDLFAGLWWPLRQVSERAPRREVAWLIAKLYAAYPLEPSPGRTLAGQLRKCRNVQGLTPESLVQRFDELLRLPLDRLEPTLRWALALLAAEGLGLDWARLTDDLSVWERESVRLKWAEGFLGVEEGGSSC